MSFSQRRSLRLSRSTIDGDINIYPYIPPTSFFLEEEEDISDKLTGLLKTTWKLYTVSPLFNLIRSEASLKHYETRIQQELMNLKIKDVNYKVILQLEPNLTASENDETAIVLEVQSKKKRELSQFYRGVFLSWRSTVQSSPNHKFINLPLLLCTGSVTNISRVHFILSRLFDCVVQKYCFTQYDFKWLSCIALKYSPPNCSSVDFTYCRARPGNNKGTISVRSSFESQKMVWDLVSEGDRITYSDVSKFSGALQEHFNNTYNIDFNKFAFKNISVSKSIVVNNAGKIRVHSVQVMDSLLKYCSTTCYSRRLIDKSRNLNETEGNTTA